MKSSLEDVVKKDTVLKWNLDHVLKPKDFDALFTSIEKDVGELDNFYSKLSPDMGKEDFKAFIDFSEKLSEKFNRLSGMPDLMESVDRKSESAKLMKSKASNLGIKYSEESTKIWNWIKGKESEGKAILDDANARRLFSAVPDLDYALSHTRLSGKYTLSEPEEKIAAAKDINFGSAIVDLRDEIATEFKYAFKPKGKKQKIIETSSELLSYVYSHKPDEREAAYISLLGKYKENVAKFFMVYQAVVKDWCYEARIRGYKSPISMRNFGNHVPDEAIETLLDVCTENRAIFHQYFKFKAKELGLKQLRRFDIYAPMKSIKEKPFSFEDGKELVLETLEKFSKGFGEKAKLIFDSMHIDSHPRPEKRSGAFCATISPNIAPYVMLNYTGKKRDISTLAHELGHAAHSLYANKHSMSSQHSSLPLAETASTFAEMIMFEKLFSEAGKKEQKAMLAEKIADSYATILRQSYFVKFEIMAHKAIQEGISAEGLSDIYFGMLKEQFGDSVAIDSSFRYEWAYIPHIVHTPFYCYAYNFGELLSLALYSRYKKEGKSFIPKIEKVLAYGGSKNPQEVLKEVGIDMCSRDFWEGSFEIIKGWQKKLEGL